MDLIKFIDELNGYISKYRKLTEENAKAIIEHVKSELDKYKLKVVYEHLSVLEKTRALITEMTASDETDAVPKVSCEMVPVPKVSFRMLITASRARSDFTVELVRQANGIIITVEEQPEKLKPAFPVGEDDWSQTTPALVCSVLSIPVEEFNIKYKQQEVLNHLDENLYDCYPILDGTIVNLYYDRNYVTKVPPLSNSSSGELDKASYTVGKWVFSTKKCFNTEGMEWRGYTYDTAIEDVLRPYGLDVSKLSKINTYTIGFKHPAFHPFRQPAEWNPKVRADWLMSAWFIQSHNNLTTKVVQDDFPIPAQEKIKIPMSIFRSLKSPLKDYLRNPEITPNFGYILRSRDSSKTGETSNVLLETTLWREIRKQIYQVPFIENRELRALHERHFKDMKYVILESYLDYPKSRIFLSLFQQYKSYYERFDKVIYAMVEDIFTELLHDLHIKKKFEKRSLPEFTKQMYDIVKQQYQPTSGASTTNNKSGSGSGSGKHDRKQQPRIERRNIRNIITNPKYTEQYYKVMYP